MTAASPRVAWHLPGLSERLHDWCLGLGSRAAALAAVTAGAVSVLAMAPFFVSPVLFITLPALIWLVDRTAPAPRMAMAAFWPGWWFGFGYFLLGLFWIGEAFLVEAERVLWALPFAVTLLPAGLAIFFGLATWAAAALSRPGFGRVLSLALMLSASEWLRGHILTGFPWNTLGYALTMPLALMQTASLVGIYGLTLAAIFIFAGPAVLLAPPAHRRMPRAVPIAACLAALPIVAMAIFGTIRLAMLSDASVPGVRLRIVQPSVPQREKWRPENQRQIFYDHIDLSQHNPSGVRDDMADITHVVWPEAAMPFRPLQSPEALAAIAQMLPGGRHLIAGGLRTVEAGAGAIEARNSLMVFGAGAALTAIYDKIHLVPFGEYLPMRPVLEKIGLEELARQRGGFGIGTTPRPLLSVPGLPLVGPLICYEAIFPAALVQTAARPGVLVNLTNDGWFGNSTGPRQHFHQTRVRAVEEGLPLVRSANNGISAVIAPSGRIIAMLALNDRGTLDADLPQSIAPTTYSRIGDWPFAVFWFLTAALGLLLRNRIKSPV